MSPTIHDVANRAKVSISTVSRVVNNPLAVRKEKRERVLQAIQELGYTPNPFASGLRDKRTMTIVAMIPDISNPFYAQLFRGMEDVARAKKNNMIICNTDQDEGRFLEYMAYFKKKKVDGMIFASDPITKTYYDSFTDLNIPVVLAATQSEEYDLPYVKVDDYQAAYDAAVFLMKNGHRSIGMISGPISDPIAGKPRLDGFRAAALKHQLECGEDRVVFGDLHFDSGYEAMRRLYGMMPDITAVFAASDSMALGAMAFVQRTGMSVPRHISIMGFDDLTVSRMVTPALTTVAQPIRELGEQAASLLFQRIENPHKLQNNITLNHEIVVRETVCNKN
ncbi:LacI family DNA-binding transcriptional regulator [Paenibacillus xerothermodurans]|uniref:LacI family transcriptional regulator n=1 Tax=Paenibacillus xerothermodurans TaxID=1977292 RepID=A0A2W1NAG9_PAEXE|nr:LacI family DNA-binding transcriptional regulator [Paenibacillus xerothermodurans]PZE20181.1 LacI family transcriptional regulator [Paenibacillus xerothermodurans]